ncbi:MAG: hypothetical protein ABIL25_03820 [candidate division WOR-3 bacterium]
MRIVSYLIVVFVLGFAVVANTGCMKCGENIARKATEKALENAVKTATGGKAQIDVSGDVDVSDLPAFLRYPGAKAVAKWSLSTGEGKGSVYSFETTDAKDAVVNWFKASFVGQGWKESAVMETGEGTMLMHQSPDEKQFATVMVGTDEGKTTVAVTYGTK